MLPLLPARKVPNGQLAPNGSLSATLDTDIIRGWWRAQPTANIGLRTGEAFDVLDIDSPAAVEYVASNDPGFHHSGPISATGNGHHLIFAVSGARNAAKIESVPLDYRGINGYIVAPPSVHPDGHTYQWIREGNTQLPEIPGWLRHILFPEPKPRRSLTDDDYISTIKTSLPPILQMITLLSKGPILKSSTKNGMPVWKTNCIFGLHNDTDPSLNIYEWDNSFFCHGCRSYGDQINLQNFISNGRLR